jgi:hypothetical protein
VPEVVLMVALSAGVCYGLFELWRSRQNGKLSWRETLIISWFALPPVILLIVSFKIPLFVTRYFIEILPPLAILLAVALNAIRKRQVLLVLVALMLPCLIISAVRVETEAYKLEDHRAGAALVARESRPGDGIGYAPAFSRLGFQYYLVRQGQGTGSLPDDFGIAPGPGPEEIGQLFSTEVNEQTEAELLLRYQRIWEISYPDAGGQWHPTPEPLLGRATSILQTEYRLVSSVDFGQVTVRLYERR